MSNDSMSQAATPPTMGTTTGGTMPPADEFELGVVTVEVTTLDGSTTIEDWDPADAPEARDYAAETANCADVATTAFRDNRTGEVTTYGATGLSKGEA